MPAVSGGNFGAGRRPRKPTRRPDVNPRTNPRALGPVAPVPTPRGKTVFTEPLAQQPFHRQQKEAAHHVAHAILDVTGKHPDRHLTDSEVQQVLRSEGGRAILKSAETITRKPEHKHNRSFFQKAVHFAFSGGGSYNQQATAPGEGSTRVLETAAKAGVQTARATYEDPIGVSTKTAKGLGQFAVGSIAAIPEIGIRTVSGARHGDPLQGVREVVHQAAKDVSRRYGAIYRGEKGAEKKFRERVKKEGAAAELVDAATIAVPEGAIIGRAGGRLARAGKLGPRAERIANAPRPDLRISGDHARTQDVHPNLFRAGAQRAQDAARTRRAEGRAAQRQKGRPVRGLQPRQGEVVKLTRRGQERAQRIDASRIAAQVFQGFQNEQAHEIDRGARREISKLSKRQRRAVYLLQGHVNLSSPEAAVASLRARNERILANRAEENAQRKAQGLAPREVGSKLHDDEVKLNGYLIEHAKEVFGDGKLAALQKIEAERSIRVAAEQADAHPAFKSSTAEARRLKVQGDALNVPHEYPLLLDRIEQNYTTVRNQVESLPDGAAKDQRLRVLNQQHANALQRLEEIKPGLDAKYSSEVRKRAQAAGLPEPAFISHQPRGEMQFSDFAPGGARAIAAPKPSRLRLHSLGIADTRPERYIQSLARTIKYKHNWPGVARQAETHSFDPKEFGSLEELRSILGRPRVNLHQLSIEDWRRILNAKGLSPKDYAFWNPGRLNQAKQDIQAAGHPAEHLENGLGTEGAVGVHDGWNASAVDEAALAKTPNASELVRSRGWNLLPREAYAEITAGTNPSGAAGRTISKIQGFQSRVLLGLNPSWLQVQVASNLLLGGFGVALKGGNPAHLVQAQRWYASLSPEAKRAVDEGLSIGVGRGHGQKTHFGASTDNAMVDWVRSVGEWPAFQTAKKYNPADLLFAGDEKQNAFFRRTLLYSSVKQQALRDIRKNVGPAFGEQRKIARVLSVKDPRKRMEEIVRNQKTFERHAEFVNEILGDYSRYTARERRTLKRAILFYGFLRYSLRFAFYTLPVKHPLAATITAKLAQLHNEEVKDLLGGDQAPWAFSRIFFEGKNGKLRSIDMGRVNPITNPIVGVVTEGPKALGGLVSPLVQAVDDQIRGESLFTGRGFRVKGSAAENRNPDLVTRGRIFANDLTSTAMPLREIGKLTAGNKTQGDDSLFFSPRPITYKTAQAQGREKQRRSEKGPPLDQVARDLLPLFLPKPDNSRDLVAQRQRLAGQAVTVPGQKGGAPVHPDSLDWTKVSIPDQSATVDWSKVRLP